MKSQELLFQNAFRIPLVYTPKVFPTNQKIFKNSLKGYLKTLIDTQNLNINRL